MRAIGRLLFRVALMAGLSASTPGLAEMRECAVAGEKIHWIADYCMSTLSTDDEIVAGSCIGDEAARAFASDCEAKLHYKKALCRLAIERRQLKDVDGCLADAAFMGATVRDGGVGGRGAAAFPPGSRPSRP